MSSEVVTPSLVYKPLSLLDSLSVSEGKHASHCMIYSSPDSSGTSYALLQMRFDGLIGFAGGEVDVQQITIEDIIEATNRELEEEIEYKFSKVDESDWICSHRDNTSRFVQHFFAKELTFDEIIYLEKTHMRAEHFPSESLGVFHVPIGGSDPKSLNISNTFLKNFLNQKFAGNARQQFIETIRKRNLLLEEELSALLDNTLKTNTNQEKGPNNDYEIKALVTSEMAVHYYDKTFNAFYCLMIVRDSGLFDFVGTDFVNESDKDLIIGTINDTLKRDLGPFCELKSEANEKCFDNDLSHIFDIKLSNDKFTKIEMNFTETENFNKTSFGIFRIPLKISGNTGKIENYMKRFFSGFLKQNFVNNSKIHLKLIHENL